MNKIAKYLATGLAVLSLNNATVALEETRKTNNASSECSLTSTPDMGTEINEDLAQKVRKLAELIMTKEKGMYKKQKKQLVTLSGTSVVVKQFAISDSKGYEFGVWDADRESSDTIDTINILEFYLNDNNERKVRYFFDYGLDGKLNLAETYIAPSNTLFPPENYHILEHKFEFEENQLKEVKKFRKEVTGEINYGAEHQEEFQREYERIIDELIQVYETE